MIAVRAWSLSGILILAPGMAHAQQRTMAMYGDWTLSCAIASGTSKSCGLVQEQKLAGSTSPVSQIGIGRDIKTDVFKISIQISADAWMPTGVKLIAGNNAPAVNAPFKWCVSTRCLAEADLSDADIKNLRAQKDAGKLVYKTASQADVSLPVSFSGFNEALDALQNEHQEIKPSGTNCIMFNGHQVCD